MHIKWWALLAAVVASSGCGTTANCGCDSSVTIALSDLENGIFDESPTAVRLCVDAKCTEFTVKSIGASESIGDIALTVSSQPPRLFFLFSEQLGLAPRAIELDVTNNVGQTAHRSWPAASFTEQSQSESLSCDPACSRASLN